MANSSLVVSNQHGINDNLLAVLAKHINHDFIKPVADHTAVAFEDTDQTVRNFGGPIILDSGCGTGESSYRMAMKYPDHLIIGIDKSAARLAKSPNTESANVVLVRADLVDMWRLISQHNWPIDKHYILYPNPWPKKQHLKRRWHGHPVFLCMLHLSECLELRTNWELYSLEFTAAVDYLIQLGKFEGKVSQNALAVDQPISHFEQKYMDSGHPLFQINIEVGQE